MLTSLLLRRRFCPLILNLLSTVIIPLSLSAENDEMFRGDAAHSGVFKSTAPTGLQPKWTFESGGAIRSSPTVAHHTVFVGSSDNHLYALDEATGALRWKFDAHGDVHSSPAVSGGLVYVTSRDGNVYAVDELTGAQRWLFATKGERRFTKAGLDYIVPSTEMMPDPWDFFLSSPAVSDGVIYVGSGDARVYALKADTGKLIWSFETGDVVHASPAVVDGVVYVGSFDSYFYAIDAASGALKWKFKTGDDPAHLLTGIPGSAAVSGGKVYFGSRDAKFYALDCETGTLLWKYDLKGSWIVASPAVFNDRVYFTTSDTHEFLALETATGKMDFSVQHHVFGFSSPAIAGDHAFFGTFDGKVHDVDLARRQRAGTFTTPGYAANAGRYLDDAGQIRRDVVWTGETLEDVTISIFSKLFSLGSFLSSPSIHDGVVFIGSMDGTLYALGR